MTPAEIERLRELRRLRLWHWQQVMHYRALATAHRNRMVKLRISSKESNRELQRFHDQTSFHLQAVVLLNDFFPVGDTAHRDYVAALKQHTIQNDT